MKRNILFFIVVLMANVIVGQEANTTQLVLHSFNESRSFGGMDNLSAHFIDDWPKDVNGDKDCALVRISFENMPKADAQMVNFDFGYNAPIRSRVNRLDEQKSEIWVFVTPSNAASMEASLEGYGKSNRLSDLRLEPKRIYDVVMKNNKTLPITIITQPDNATVSLVDLKKSATTPATISGVPLGTHKLVISIDGQMIADTLIEVSDYSTMFKYDFRKDKEIEFVSDPSGADLYLNDEYVGKTPMKLTLKYASYRVEARLNADETDARDFTVNELVEDRIVLEPIEKKTFEVFATYNGSKVDADLYIDGELERPRQSSYQLTKPVGEKYIMNMTYGGNGKKRTIRVSRNMDVEQEFKIPARNSFVWPWQREYDASPVGFSMGYVTKQWVTSGEGARLKEDVWGRENKRLHGLQVGLHFQPCFSWGLGLYSGLFYEYYMSWNEEMKEQGYMDHFQEHCLYMPIHAYYRLPFANKVALAIHGGIGLDYGLYASFSSTEYENSEPSTEYYGLDGWPNRFNASAEIGVGFRVGKIQVNAQYSKGLSDHKFYSDQGEFKTIQNKLSLTISWMFSGSSY